MKCNYFNSARGCISQKCSMVHACYVCNGSHGMGDFPKKPKGHGNSQNDDRADKGAGKGKKGKKGKKNA